MLLSTSPRRSDESGSALVTVLVITLVLGLLTVTLSAAVINTTRTTVSVRGSLQAQAAADAGIAAAVAFAKTDGVDICGAGPVSETAPRYKVNRSSSEDGAFAGFTRCPDDATVVFRAVGFGEDGSRAVSEVAYAVTRASAATPSTGADMVFFGDATFTSEVRTHGLNADLLSIRMPRGSLTCQNHIPANIVVGGNFTTRGGCIVDGGVAAGGNINMTNGPDTVKGNLSGSGTGTATIQGIVGGSLHVGGAVDFGWNARTYAGNIRAGGKVNMANNTFAGSLTLPSSATLERDGSKVASGATSDPRIRGGISWPASVPPPPAPVMEGWFEYRFASADWPGYTVRTLSTSGSGTWTCNRFNANDSASQQSAGWRVDLPALTSPTVIDARACGTLSSNNGSSPVVSLKTDVVFLAKNFDLTALTIQPNGSTPRHVWWVVEDPSADGTPTCTGSMGTVAVNTTRMLAGIKAMIYTPCRINITGGGEWHGSFYGGGFIHGGDLAFYSAPIALPGQGVSGSPGAGSGSAVVTLGQLLTRRDVAR